MNKKQSSFHVFDHTADLGIEVCAPSLKSLFEEAAIAMMHIMIAGKGTEGIRLNKILLSAEDLADLMVRWLSELLYLLDGEKKVVTRVEVNAVSSSLLEAMVKTTPFNAGVHVVSREIKAVTYHQIAVTQIAGDWKARIVFDL